MAGSDHVEVRDGWTAIERHFAEYKLPGVDKRVFVHTSRIFVKLSKIKANARTCIHE